jgi:hypothetical protein
MRERYAAQVLVDANSQPYLVFAKGRTKFHAVTAKDRTIALVALPTLRDLRPLLRRGEPYPPKRCASFWLNHDHREVTKRTKQVLRGLVSRKSADASPGGV